MEVQNQLQLACLLDKLSELYRGGVPSSAISMIAPGSEVSASTADVRLRLVVRGESGSLSQEEQALLDAIATNGLRLASHEYTKEFIQGGIDPFSGDFSQAPVTILFGFDGLSGRSVGTVIQSAPVRQLVADANSKKTLWRELQQRWPK